MQEILREEAVERRRSIRLVRFDEPGSRRLTATMQPVASQRASLSVPPMKPAAFNSSLSKVQCAQDPLVSENMVKLERRSMAVTEEKTLVLDDVVVV